MKSIKAMKKLQKVFDDAYQFGKLPKGFALVQFRHLESIAEAIERGENPVFFETEINNLLNKCGIKTEQYGIINYRVC